MAERKILIVDDEPETRKLYKKILTDAGYKVMDAKSGKEALKILRRENIQAIFLDLNTPGMSGIELCRKIRKDKPISCITAITGYSSIFELAECREAGFDDYYKKPIEIDVLLKAAENSFEKLERWKKR